MIEIIKQEIEWSEKHADGAPFQKGFIAGLKQALFLLEGAEKKTAEIKQDEN